MSATNAKRRPEAPVGRPGPPPAGSANLAHTVSKHSSFCSVRVWRHSDGGEWETFDKDLVSVDVQHALGQPSTFSLSVAPRRYRIDDTGEAMTWAEILRPMDYVEITLATSRRYLRAGDIRERVVAGDRAYPHVVLRGFISECRYVDAADARGGAPQRRVLISGQNFHKLWINYKIFYLPERTLVQAQGLKRIAQIFGSRSLVTPNELFDAIYRNAFLPQLATLADTLPVVKKHGIWGDMPDQFAVYLQNAALSAFQGSLDQMIRTFAKTPYTEFFTYDEPWPGGSPRTQWRWAPLTDAGNRLPIPSFLRGDDRKLRARVLHADEISSHSVAAGDTDLYTYFWATPDQSMGAGIGSQISKVRSPGYLSRKYPIHGFRPLEPSFGMYRLKEASPAPVASNPDFLDVQVGQLTNWLAACFVDSDQHWGGDAQCHGRPDIMVGEYLDLPEWGKRFYVEGVTHRFVFPESYSTQLRLTRGQPWGDRAHVLPPGYLDDPASPTLPPGIPVDNAPSGDGNAR